ncbi:hypothetical protein H2201_007160 [Coniosporium apollinis]|uniref:Large ribosomal subunit protein mL40 n=1 Tax=Coniosporium apollinis TaxID=61459 RepID=A0ABQ9NJS0_9PEZI|nr:hypothetical protein H2201_007160 [Coniosporium apollinis]
MRHSAIIPAFRPTFRCLSRRTTPLLSPARPIHPRSSQTALFSTTAPLHKRSKKGEQKKDTRITAIQYHLRHPLNPRPLRLSRLRALRHWTIHRAWQLYKAQTRRAHELELERQYNSMRDACEALRLIGDDGMPASAGTPGGTMGKELGRLYRVAMEKKGIWGGVPIEYARMQVDYPSREGWNHGWTR